MSDLSVHPVYLSARAAIVAPERAIPVSLYATQKWLPRLGPERWCLVLLLRSLCIDSQRRSDGTKRVSCSWRHLAEIMDVHEETVASWLKHQPIPNDKPWRRIIPSDEKSKALSLFIPRLRYAYETHKGKTRRIGFLLEVLMDDPVVPEDEVKLKKQMEVLRMQQGELGLETYRVTDQVNSKETDLPQISENLSKQHNLDLRYVNPNSVDLHKQANSNNSDLHNNDVNPENAGLRASVKQHNLDLESYVNQVNPTSQDSEPEDYGKNVNKLDTLIQQLKYNYLKKNVRRDAFEPIIHLTETLLQDDHSKGLFFKVLNALYPERLDLYIAAIRVALESAEMDSKVNRGAVFVRSLREFATIAGVDLGLKSVSENSPDADFDGNPGSQNMQTTLSFSSPSVDEAVWTETQLILRRQMTQATYDAIIQGTVLLGQNDDKYIVGVPTEMAKDWLENRLHDIVQRALSSVVGMSISIEFRLMKDLKEK